MGLFFSVKLRAGGEFIRRAILAGGFQFSASNMNFRDWMNKALEI
jgi:hypothetical protein